MLKMDFSEHAAAKSSDEKAYSQEDKRFLSTVESNVRRIEGHYKLPLPFRVEVVNNREQAVKRANWQRKKMLSNMKYRKDYTSFVNGVIAKRLREESITRLIENRARKSLVRSIPWVVLPKKHR